MSSSWTSLPGLSGAYAFIRYGLRNRFVLHAALLSFFCLSACGDASSQGQSVSQQSPAQVSTQGNTLAPLLAPPGSGDRPAAPGSLGRGIASDGLPSLQPAKGTNVSIDNLFAEDIRDPLERTKRVETAVLELRRDLDATLPAIKRLVAVEKDIQMLVSQLETLLGEESQPVAEQIAAEQPITDPVPLGPPKTEIQDAVMGEDQVFELTESTAESSENTSMEDTPLAPVTAIAGNIATNAQAPPEAQPPPQPDNPVDNPSTEQPVAAQATGLRALGLRLGEHSDKTRLVIDLSGKIEFTSDLDNGEKILVIELQDALWSGPQTQNFNSGLVQSMSTQPLDNGTGTRLIVVLKKETSLLYQSILSPDGPAQNYRLVIDLKN